MFFYLQIEWNEKLNVRLYWCLFCLFVFCFVLFLYINIKRLFIQLSIYVEYKLNVSKAFWEETALL